jgi:hypothetical protein
LGAETPASAGLGSDSLIERYAINLDDRTAEPVPVIKAPQPLSIGVYGMIQKRELSFSGYGTEDATLNHAGVSLGWDATPWLTIRALLAGGNIDTEAISAERVNPGLECGAGIKARLLNWRFNPLFMNVLWMRFDLSAYYRKATADSDRNKADWQEGYGDLTLSLVTIPPDIEQTVKSISLFAGPALSRIDGRVRVGGNRVDFNEDQRFGLTTGIVVAPRDNISMKLEAQYFEDISYEAAVSFHF